MIFTPFGGWGSLSRQSWTKVMQTLSTNVPVALIIPPLSSHPYVDISGTGRYFASTPPMQESARYYKSNKKPRLATG